MRRLSNRPLAAFVAFALVVGLVPLNALAEEDATLPEEAAVVEQAPQEVEQIEALDEPEPELEPEATNAPDAEPAAEADEESLSEDASSVNEPTQEAVPAVEAPDDPEHAPVTAAEAEAPRLIAQATTVDSVSITVTPPAAGDKEVDAEGVVSIPAGSHCSLRNAYWVLGDSSSTEINRYTDVEAGQKYALTIVLLADKGYTFQDGSSYAVAGAAVQDGGQLRVINRTEYELVDGNYVEFEVSEGWANVLVTPTEPTTVDLRISTPGHGTIKVNGSDYGTECKGTWARGAQVTAEAVPDAGYSLNRWWTRKADGTGSISHDSTITLVAGTDLEAEATFGLETASIAIAVPTAGSTAATAPKFTLPDGAGYSLDSSVTPFGGASVRWVTSGSLADDEALDASTVFEAGKTYYAYVRLVDGEDSFAAVAGGSSFDTELDVTGGGTLSDQGNYAGTREGGETYMGIMAIIAVTIPKVEPKDVYIDNTVDNSVSYVTGAVHLTGAGGMQAGYGDGKVVYDDSASVTYSKPKTAQVQGMINDAYTKVYEAAKDVRDRGKRGEFHMSTSESTGKVWDRRKYDTVEDGDAVSIGDSDYLDGAYGVPSVGYTRTHIASGDYGKETFYRVEANGWVDGWDITVSNDGNGTASADLERSLAEETVTLTAMPAEGYAFKEWVVVSGGAELADATASSTTFEMPYADVEVKATFVPAHTHDWGEPTYEWSEDNATVTASRVCKDDPSHAETEEVATTADVTKPATCVSKGETTYTATFANPAFATQTKTVEDVDVDPGAHAWGTGVVTTEPTCTEPGVRTFECTLCGETKTEPVAALGHEWGEWTIVKQPTETEDGLEQRVCKRDKEHVEVRTIAATGRTYTITFDPAGGSLNGSTKPVTTPYKEGTLITMPTPVRDGYTFLYWKGSEHKAGESYEVVEDHTFVAEWEKKAEKRESAATAKKTKSSGSSSSKATLAKTGDSTPVALMGALVTGGLILASLGIKRRRRG